MMGTTAEFTLSRRSSPDELFDLDCTWDGRTSSLTVSVGETKAAVRDRLAFLLSQEGLDVDRAALLQQVKDAWP